ncbi:MAG: flotillin-like FloA family protein, partial [Vicinamibacteria bacterium]
MGFLAIAFLVLIAAGFILYFVPLGLWIAAFSSGAYVGIGTLIAMRLRRVPPSLIVKPRISAVKAGLNLSVDELEAHY